MSSLPLQSGSVLLFDVLGDHRALLCDAPREVLSCRHIDAVGDFLDAVEARRKQGRHLAGFMAYELGYAFEEKLRARWRDTGDLLGWFGVYDTPVHLSIAEAKEVLARSGGDGEGAIGPVAFDMTRADYETAFDAVQRHLVEGDVYQVNLTMRARFDHHGPPEAILLRLMNTQPVAHGAFLKLEDRDIVSLSPELFLEREGSVLRTRPMKGTAPRGRTEAEDRDIARNLAADPKQRAENVMIVDLMRNDLSRVARDGTVRVTELCQVERFKSLHQMTSTVQAQVRDAVEFPQIIENLFPCGSITGAPKLSAMVIADRLETGPRGLYTGSIGHLAPSGDFRFNVAIRTLVLHQDGRGEAGAGSGVVFDSGATPEYDESMLKLRFMTTHTTPFALIETMACHPGTAIARLDRHMDRLAASARYFGFPLDTDAARRALEEIARSCTEPLRLRLVLDETGAIETTATALGDTGAASVWDVAVAAHTTRSDDPFLFHKTTNREFYDETRAAYSARTGCREVVFENEAGWLTEGSFTNLFVEKDGRLLTPALGHGLLPGTLRAELIDQGKAVEADLTVRDLAAAETFYVGNSLRGLVRARLIDGLGDR